VVLVVLVTQLLTLPFLKLPNKPSLLLTKQVKLLHPQRLRQTLNPLLPPPQLLRRIAQQTPHPLPLTHLTMLLPLKLLN
jgi:hypothetical protein